MISWTLPVLHISLEENTLEEGPVLSSTDTWYCATEKNCDYLVGPVTLLPMGKKPNFLLR